MGCDIHMCIEVRPYSDGKWRPALMMEATWSRRNYALFSWLANVRNYSEPAIRPIAEPRGLPDDVSGAVRVEFDDLGADGHSHSWLLASEILDAAARPDRPQWVGEFVDWLEALLADERTMLGGWRKKDVVRLVFAFDN